MAHPYANVAFTNGYEFTAGSGYRLPEYPFVAPPELAAGRVGRHKVAIVGGGITGLTMACSLARLGIEAVLAGKGIQWSVGRTFAGADEVYSFDLKQQASYNLSTQPPFINIQQFYIEGYLVERIYELGHVDLRWNNRVSGFEQDAEGATLTVETPAGPYRLQADYVVDATGSHSPFRKWVDASVTAKKGDDRWCIADVRFLAHGPHATERHTWIEAAFNENRAVWQHPMGDDVWRIDYQMAPNADPEEVSREDVVRARLARHFGKGTEFELVWVGPYAYKSECVDELRHGRVFFMGDAAKVVSPFGARGGNTGIADAENLAWKLAAVLQGRAGTRLLDSYHDERHEAARQNVMVTNRTARFLRPADGMERVFRQAALGLARRFPFARQLVNTGRMAVANTYSRSCACDAGGGQPVQNVAFQWADGSIATLADLLRWADGRLLLLLFGDASRKSLERLQALCESAPVVAVQVLGPDETAGALEHVRDPKGHLQGACHVFGHAWALVRPDAYVAATGEAVDAHLVDAMARALGAEEADA